MKSWLTENFSIKYPIIMAPMFLVSNEEMICAATKAGIMGCIPALNWRTTEEFETAMKHLKMNCKGPFGINLIVNKSNLKLKDQIAVCKKYQPDFIITSLGSPEETIKECQSDKCKIICDVTDSSFAKKVEDLGADAIIAVNSGAGGHAGKIPPSILIPKLKQVTKLPIISAGGVGESSGMLSMLALGVEGLSIGTPFIATRECNVNEEYKDACIKYDSSDIVMTTKISGTPCTIINTPYVKKIGTNQNAIESFLSKNKKIKKFAKAITYYKGMKALEKAAFAGSYKTLFCAGPSLEFTTKQQSVDEVVNNIVKDLETEKENLLAKF